jgi:hypothetical protein
MWNPHLLLPWFVDTNSKLLSREKLLELHNTYLALAAGVIITGVIILLLINEEVLFLLLSSYKLSATSRFFCFDDDWLVRLSVNWKKKFVVELKLKSNSNKPQRKQYRL